MLKRGVKKHRICVVRKTQREYASKVRRAKYLFLLGGLGGSSLDSLHNFLGRSLNDLVGLLGQKDGPSGWWMVER